MIRLLTCITLLIANGIGLAQNAAELEREGEVSVSAFFEESDSLWFTQQARFFVEVRTNTWFTEAPRYPEIKLDGAIAIQPAGFATNYTEQERGQTIVVQRRTYLVFPQRAGELTVPSIDVRFGTSVDGTATELLTLTTDPVTVPVRIPDEAKGLSQLVSTPQLRVSERVDGELDNPKVGDAITRTVTISGEQTLALVLPKIEFVDQDGLSVYASQPQLNDSANRGQYRGERVDKATYVFEQAGSYTLPSIEIHWWDPDANELHTETLDAIELVIAESPAALLGENAPEAIAETNSFEGLESVLQWIMANIATLSMAVAVAYLAATVTRRWLPPLLQKRRDSRNRYRDSEERYFKVLRHACKSGDLDAIRPAFWAWLDRVPEVSTMADLAAKTRMPELEQLWIEISAEKFGQTDRTGSVNAGALLDELSNTRQNLLTRDAQPSKLESINLNPQTY